MKKIVFAISVLLLGITEVNAQKKSAFEGVVVYDMSFGGSGLPPEAIAMLKGSTITMYMKDHMRREDMKTPIATSSNILDEKSKTMVNLMDMVGKKYLIRSSENELKKEEENTVVSAINYSEETKTIAGYKCKKADVTVKINQGKEETVTVFYTDKLPYSDFRAAYKGLKGFPMEYTITQNGMKLSLTASKVSKEAVGDDKFAIPSGYTETTLEELRKNGGQ